jgi:NADH-quinone oxidoreductase subunit G
VGVLTGGRLTVEDAYAYSKFTRAVLHTNDIDFRARPLSVEEADFLASSVTGVTEVTYADVEAAPAVVLVGLEPEEECPILFLRLFKAVRKRRLAVHAVAPFLSRGLEKLGSTLLATVPGDEAAALASAVDARGDSQHGAAAELRDALSQPGSVLFVGERLATVGGGLSAAVALANTTGAKLAWVPRRAGDRGAVDAGCLPNLLPGGRPVIDAGARAELGDAWRIKTGTIPGSVGRDTDAILDAAVRGRIGALVVAGVDPADLADPDLAERALDEVGFLVSLEVRRSPVTERADVVFPVAPVVEKAGTFLDWEGRLRPFEVVLETPAVPDARVLDGLAREMGYELGCADVVAIRRELGSLPTSSALGVVAPRVEPGAARRPGDGEAVLATWHQLIDGGRLLEGDPYLAGTARPTVVRLGKALASRLDVADGAEVVVSTDRGEIGLPVEVTEMPDGVVWLPTNSIGSSVRRVLGATYGSVVTVRRGFAENGGRA